MDVEDQDLDHLAVEDQAMDRTVVEGRALDHLATEVQALDHLAVEVQASAPPGVEAQAMDLLAVGDPLEDLSGGGLGEDQAVGVLAGATGERRLIYELQVTLLS